MKTLEKNLRYLFVRKSSRREIKTKLLRLGIVKPSTAEYLIRDLLGDSSAAHDENQLNVLKRLELLNSVGEDIIVDLRSNNGAKPKYDDFWNVVAEYIDTKTAVDDRRHGGINAKGGVVVNMALAGSYADLYRQCVKIAHKSNINAIPTYAWFLLQFWPSSASASKLLHYTGRFKVKRMVQARILRKHNVDLHYNNAIFSFLKKRAKRYVESTTFVTADAKCKVSVGEPGFPIAAVARGKKVIVGENEVVAVGDHDLSRNYH